MSGWSKHHNPDRTLSIYNNGKFVAAIENTTASCDLFYQFSTEIKRLEAELDKLKRANEIAVDLLEQANQTVKSHAMQTYSKVSSSLAAEIDKALEQMKAEG